MGGDGGTGTLRQAGYAIMGSGGGGADGQYVFASLAELDEIIREWDELRNRIRVRGEGLARAMGLIEPPAEDVMSRLQARMAVYSLKKALSHSQAMDGYADGFVRKLQAARKEYAAMEAGNTRRLRKVGG